MRHHNLLRPLDLAVFKDHFYSLTAFRERLLMVGKKVCHNDPTEGSGGCAHGCARAARGAAGCVPDCFPASCPG